MTYEEKSGVMFDSNRYVGCDLPLDGNGEPYLPAYGSPEDTPEAAKVREYYYNRLRRND